MTETYGNLAYSDGMKPIEEMTLLELTELLRRIADEIQLREMQNAE